VSAADKTSGGFQVRTWWSVPESIRLRKVCLSFERKRKVAKDKVLWAVPLSDSNNGNDEDIMTSRINQSNRGSLPSGPIMRARSTSTRLSKARTKMLDPHSTGRAFLNDDNSLKKARMLGLLDWRWAAKE